MAYFYVELGYGSMCDTFTLLKGVAKVVWQGVSVRGNTCAEVKYTDGTLQLLRLYFPDPRHTLVEIDKGQGRTLAKQLELWG